VDIRRHAVTSYSLSGYIGSFHHGLFAAFWGLIFGSLSAVSQIFWRADIWARSQGALGCLFGAAISPFYIVIYGLIALLICVDRLSVGIANGCCGKHKKYIFDPSQNAKVHETPTIAVEKESFVTHGIPKARRGELHKSLAMVVKARVVFQNCKPTYPDSGHMHFKVVKLDRLRQELESTEGKRELALSNREVEKVLQRLDKNSLPTPLAVKRFSTLHSMRLLDKKETGEGVDELSIPSTIRETEEASEMLSSSITVDASPREYGQTEKEGSSGFLSERTAPLKKFMDDFFSKKNPESTEISFSHFIQALQAVSRDKVQHLSRRRSAVSMRQFPVDEQTGEFSEYLS